MIDFLGNLKINTLKLSKCVFLLGELEIAHVIFTKDNDKLYLKLCDKIESKVILAGYN